MQNYDASNIKVLKGLEAVRKRPGMYIGDTNINGLHHMIYEIVDNSIDEAMAGFCTKIHIIITKNNSVIVRDNGRGIPVDMHPTENLPAATVVLTTLHAGGKFDKDTYKVSGGLHGVGVSVVNALSKKLIMHIKKNGKIYYQTFEKGIPQNPLEIIGNTKEHGTEIEFFPDGEIMEVLDFDFEILKKRFKEMAYLNPNITIFFDDERGENPKKKIYHFDDGISEFVKDINKKTPITKIINFHASEKNDDESTDIEVAFLYNEGYDEKLHSFVNNINTINGGTHEAGFRAGLSRAILNYIDENASPREKDSKIIGDDVREGLCAIVSVKLMEPQFEGQTKSKLGSSFIKPIIQKLTFEKVAKFLEENPNEARVIMTKVLQAAKGREAAKKARELVRKNEKTFVGTLPGKLADCQSKDPKESEIYLVEGDSAGGSAKQGRDRVFQAILPLRGKILNVEKSNINKILKSDEIKNMITAFGCGIGNEFNIERLRYHKIIIMTDADVDGSHIQTLLMTFFYRYLKPLITNGFLYIAQPPLYRFKKGKKEIYLKDEKALNEFLIVNGIENFNIQGVGNKELIEILKMISHYRNLLRELQKNHPFIDLIEFLVRNQDLVVEKNYKNIFEKIREFLIEIDVNIINFEQNENHILLYIQTKTGLMKSLINSKLFDDVFFKDACNIYKKIMDYDLEILKNPINFLQNVEESAKKGAYIQRYKGLGEMNADQLWETTMDVSNRTLLKVALNDENLADDIFTLFMGDEVEPRRDFIQTNAKNVKNLDI